jgi:hypothetical protein
LLNLRKSNGIEAVAKVRVVAAGVNEALKYILYAICLQTSASWSMTGMKKLLDESSAAFAPIMRLLT